MNSRMKNNTIFLVIATLIIALISLGTFAFSSYVTKSKVSNSSLQVAKPVCYIDKATTSNFHITEENTNDDSGRVEGTVDFVIKNYYNQNDVNGTRARAYIQFFTAGNYDMSNFDFQTLNFSATTDGSEALETPDITTFKFKNGKSDWFDLIPTSSTTTGETIKIKVRVYCHIQDLSEYKNSNKDITEDLQCKVHYEQLLPMKA